MESIRFADILFTLIVLLVTFAILWWVNKSKNQKKKPSKVKIAVHSNVASVTEDEKSGSKN